jgi:hypothetical protein
VLDLEESAELHIVGDGEVEFGDGSIINLKGVSGSTSTYPAFVLRFGSTLKLPDNSTLYVRGKGSFVVENAASVLLDNISNGKTIVVGNSYEDDIKFYVRGSGLVHLEGGGATMRYSANDYGRLSFHKGAAQLIVDQGGIISIQNKGWLEINSLNGEVGENVDTTEKGNMQKIILGPAGMLFLHSGGKISFADNRYLANTILWKSSKVILSAGGTVEYKYISVNSPYNAQGFEGTLQSSYATFDNLSIDAKTLVRTLVNQVPALSAATVFTTAGGVQTLRLKNGKQVTITSGDTLTSEDSTGNVSGTDSSGQSIQYMYPYGTRVIKSA